MVDADIRKSPSHKSDATIPVKLDTLIVSPSHIVHVQEILDHGKSLSDNQGDTVVIQVEDWENAKEEEIQSALLSDDPHKVLNESPHIIKTHQLQQTKLQNLHCYSFLSLSWSS